MIIDEKKSDVVVSGDMESSSFSIAANSKAYQILSSSIYTYKVRAVIRESACNAFDAHVEAGNDQPFDVHLPNRLEPWYSIRDYGISMDHDTCMKLYSQYFHSTKTKSNDVIGCLGIGSKSPLCLVESFNVTAFLDGEKRVYSVYNDSDKCPKITLMGREQTDEPDGIEISMQVDGRIVEFQDEAVRVFKYFDVLPNINDSSVVEEIQEFKAREYDFVSEDFAIRSSGYGLKAVMGNVAYAIPEDVPGLKSLRVGGVIKFALGELSFDPGRENLSLDEKTIAAITTKVEKIRNTLKQDVLDSINNEPTPYKKYKKWLTLSKQSVGRAVGIDNFEYAKEYKLPSTEQPMVTYSGTYYGNNSVSKSETCELPFEGCRYFRFQPRFQRRIERFLKDTSYRFSETSDWNRIVLLTEEQVAETLIDEDLLEDLDAVIPKLERNRSGGVKRSKVTRWNGTSYNDSCSWDDEIIDTSEEHVYVEINRYTPKNCALYATRELQKVKSAFEKLGIDMPEIYGLKTAYLKTKAFKSGKWIHLDDYLKSKLGPHAPKTQIKCSGQIFFMQSLDNNITGIDGLDDFITLNESRMEQDDNLISICIDLGYKISSDYSMDDMRDAILEKYPMLKFVQKSSTYNNYDEVQEYINLVNQK